MPADKFKLPKSSYEELAKIIKAYGHFNEPASLEEVSRLVGMHTTVISRNTGFLIEVNILESGAKKHLTTMGYELARALEHEMPNEIRKWWEKIVEENDFLTKLLSAIKIRSGMDDQTLQAHIAYSAGQPKKKEFMTGARTIIDVLRAAEIVSEEDGKIVVSNNHGESVEKSEKSLPSKIVTNVSNKEVVEEPAVISQIKPSVVSVGKSQISVNIDIKIDCKASDLDGLGKKLRALIDDFQRDNSEKNEDEA